MSQQAQLSHYRPAKLTKCLWQSIILNHVQIQCILKCLYCVVLFVAAVITMWSRAVWQEGTKEVEDVILSKWICSKKVLWPRKEALTATKKQLSPTPDWFKFDLRKVKISSGKMLLFD